MKIEGYFYLELMGEPVPLKDRQEIQKTFDKLLNLALDRNTPIVAYFLIKGEESHPMFVFSTATRDDISRIREDLFGGAKIELVTLVDREAEKKPTEQAVFVSDREQKMLQAQFAKHQRVRVDFSLQELLTLVFLMRDVLNTMSPDDPKSAKTALGRIRDKSLKAIGQKSRAVWNFINKNLSN